MRTDDLDRRGERVIVLASLALAAGLPWFASGDHTWLFRAPCAGALIMLSLAGWRAAGWLGGSAALRRAVWASDGRWLLEFADGHCAEGRLSVATRALPMCVHLVWRTTRGRREMWVVARPGQAAFRRLAARLRLEAQVPSPAHRQPDPAA